MRTKEYLPKKISLALNSPDFGGRSSRNEARFSDVTRNVLSNSKHTLLLPFSAVTEKPSGNPKDTLLLSRESNNPPANGLEFVLLFRLPKHRFPMPKLPKRRTRIKLMCKSELYLRMQGMKVGFSSARKADNSVNSMPICANYSQICLRHQQGNAILEKCIFACLQTQRTNGLRKR